MRIALLGLLIAVAVAGCGSDGDAGRTPTALTSDFAPGTQTVDPRALERASTTGRAPPVYEPTPGEPIDGRGAVDQLGCLACHQIGARGNSGPGNNLAGIGSRRSAAQIRRALDAPPAPMPSYRQLPERWKFAVVAYLASLRGDDCSDGGDCG